MFAGMIAFVISVFVGPVVFWVLSHTIYADNNLKKYPTQINDRIGDLVFLPLFNAVIVELIIKSNHSFDSSAITISVIASLIFTTAYVYYQRNLSDYVDWSKPEKGRLNFGGWYHAVYMFLEASIIAYGLISFYNNIWVWILAIGYPGTTIIQYLKEGYV